MWPTIGYKLLLTDRYRSQAAAIVSRATPSLRRGSGTIQPLHCRVPDPLLREGVARETITAAIRMLR